MSASPDRIARFSLIDGEMILHTRAGDWVFYQDHLAALAAAEARGRVQGVREAAGKAYEVLNGHGQTLLGYECRAAIRSILTQDAAE